MRIPSELAVAFVAGLFGLIPLMVQIASTRAQRRDRTYRLNQLRAELELLERIDTLQSQVSAGDEAAKHRTSLIISDSLSKLLDDYNKLSEIAPSAVVGGTQPSPQQLSFLRRAFLLYNPHTTSGWIWHTLFYVFAIIFVWFSAAALSLWGSFVTQGLLGGVMLVLPIGIVLLISQRLARHNAAHTAAQLDEPNA